MAAAAVATVVEPDGPLSSSFFNGYRPWLSLYGVRLQRQHTQKQVGVFAASQSGALQQ